METDIIVCLFIYSVFTQSDILITGQYISSSSYLAFIFLSLTEGEEDAQRNSKEQSGDTQGEAAKSES